MGVQAVQAAVYEDFGNSQGDVVKFWTDRLTGPDHKTRAPVVSRPGSTVAYSRNDGFTAMYDSSPVTDGLQGRALLDHQDAVDQFNVRPVPLSTIIDSSPTHRVLSKSSMPSCFSSQYSHWLLYRPAIAFAKSCDRCSFWLQVPLRVTELHCRCPRRSSSSCTRPRRSSGVKYTLLS